MKRKNSISMDEVRIDLFEDGRLINHLFNYPDRPIRKNSKEFRAPSIVLFRCLLFCGLIPLLLLFFSNLYYGTLVMEGDSRGFLEDYGFFNMVILFSIIPFGVYLYFEKYRTFFYKMQEIINKRKLSIEVVEDPDEKEEDEKEKNPQEEEKRRYWAPVKKKLSDMVWIVTSHRFEVDVKEPEKKKIRGKEAYDSYLDRVGNLMCGKGRYSLSRKVYFGMSWAILAIFFYYLFKGGAMIGTSAGYYYDVHNYPITFGIFVLYWGVVFGLIYYFIVWKMFFSPIVLNNFIRDMKKAIKLKLFHSDGVGGMSPLGNTVLAFHFVILLPLENEIVALYLNGLSMGVIVSGVVYIPVIIIVFFVPFIAAHGIMKKHKEKQLEFLGSVHDRFVNRWKSIHDSYTRKRTKNTCNTNEMRIMEMTEKVRGYYNDVKAMPVWPFNLSILSRFATSIMVPLLLMFLQIMIS